MKKISLYFKTNRWLFALFLIFISLFSFSIILIPREVSIIKTIGAIVRYNASRFLLVVVTLLLVSFYIKRTRLSQLLTALIIFPIFSFALVGLWASAYTETNVIAGLLPRRDAFAFFTDSLALLEKGYLVGYAKRRPLFSGFLAFFLWLANGNFQIAMAATVYITAVVTYFSLFEVNRALNPPSAVLFFIPQFLYIRRFIGNVLSENLGYILGMGAFTLFLIALRRKREQQKNSLLPFLFAVFLFTLAQLARPGAIITLPFLIIFAGWLWKGKRKFSWKLAALTSLCIIAGFLINSFVFNQIVPTKSSQFTNIGYGIYGVVAGGKSWSQIFIDHPEIGTFGPGIRERKIMEIILLEILNHPENFIKGMMVQFSSIFSLNPINNYNVYSCMLTSNQFMNYALVYAYFTFSIIGIVHCIIRRKTPLFVFALVLLVGFLFSLPVSPAYQTQYMRYYAASTSLLGILPALGFSIIIQLAAKKLNLTKLIQPSDNHDLSDISIIFSILLTVIVLIGPLLIMVMAPKKELTSRDCLSGENEVVLNYYPGSHVSIISHGPTWVPNISEHDYRKGIHNIPDKETIDYFDNIPLPNAIFPALNLIDDNSLYVVMDVDQIPDKKTLLHACGTIEDLPGGDFFYPSRIEKY
jgi:hypothetical protein